MALESTTCGIVHHARQNISNLGQMALESTTCGIVHHARRNITASGHTACVMHNAVPTSAVLHLVGTTNLILCICVWQLQF